MPPAGGVRDLADAWPAIIEYAGRCLQFASISKSLRSYHASTSLKRTTSMRAVAKPSSCVSGRGSSAAHGMPGCARRRQREVISRLSNGCVPADPPPPPTSPTLAQVWHTQSKAHLQRCGRVWPPINLVWTAPPSQRLAHHKTHQLHLCPPTSRIWPARASRHPPSARGAVALAWRRPGVVTLLCCSGQQALAAR